MVRQELRLFSAVHIPRCMFRNLGLFVNMPDFLQQKNPMLFTGEIWQLDKKDFRLLLIWQRTEVMIPITQEWLVMLEKRALQLIRLRI